MSTRRRVVALSDRPHRHDEGFSSLPLLRQIGLISSVVSMTQVWNAKRVSPSAIPSMMLIAADLPLMARFDWVQCPACGWTGRRSELDTSENQSTCPACETFIRTD